MSFITSAGIKFRHLIIRIIAPAIVNWIFHFSSRKKKTLLIIKTDGIGDYILFRNYLKFLRNSKKYRYYKIYLLANLACENIAIHLDSNTIDGFFWYSDGFFLKWKLVKLLFNLQRLKLSTIIYPNYSRIYTIDWLVHHVKAENKIAVNGNTINESIELRNKANKYYTELINVDAIPKHEFERNKQIFELITSEKSDLKYPYINKDRLNILPNQSIIIFSGGSDINKKWSSKNYNNLCQRIIDELDTNIILAGGNGDTKDGLEIQNGLIGDRLSNQIGVLNLAQLCELIGGSKLLISNDTVAIHLAAALNIPAVCIAKGDLYGRFVPYPPKINNKIFSVFPKSLIAEDQDQNKWSSMNINDVLLEDVYHAVLKAINA